MFRGSSENTYCGIDLGEGMIKAVALKVDGEQASKLDILGVYEYSIVLKIH